MAEIKEVYADGTVKYRCSNESVEYKPLEVEGIESIVSNENGFSAIKQTEGELTLFCERVDQS